MATKNAIYRYASNLQLIFPEGLEEITFIKEIEGFNYLFVKNPKNSKIKLPEEFEVAELPQVFLQKITAEKYQEIEVLRKTLQFENIIYQDAKFSASQMARQNILGAISILNNSQNSKHYWKDINETSYQFSLNDFNEILKLIAARDTKFYYIEAQVKNEINSALTAQSGSSIDVKDIWQKYEESYKAA